MRRKSGEKKAKFLCSECRKVANETNWIITKAWQSEKRLHDIIPELKRQYYLGPKCTIDCIIEDMIKIRDKLVELMKEKHDAV